MSEDHGLNNAKAWHGSIVEMVAALECDYDRLEELREERDGLDADNAQDAVTAWDATDNGAEYAALKLAATLEGDEIKDADEARERIEQSVLSVELRSGWYTPGSAPEPEEFSILLTTGGPALRIRGELDNGQPSRAWLEYRDWGTSWTEYHGEGCDYDAILTFSQVFYFGE